MTHGGERAYEFGPFLLNAAERVLMCQGQRVPLTPKVFETLLVLVENAGHIVQKETLFKRVWPDAFVQEDSLTFNISTLRKALGGHGTGQQFIQTEHKLGYRFVAPVKIVLPTSPDAEVVPSLNSNGIGMSPGAATAPPSGCEVVRDEGFSLRRRVKWAALGLALLIVVATVVWLATPHPQPKILKYDQITADGREKSMGLATDGERVYFGEQASTGWVIAQVSASGGEPVPISSIPRDSLITDISPDHRDLLVVEERAFAPGTLEVMPLFAGEPRRLGNLRAYSASWSPDARTLAYTTDGGVYLCDPDGSNSRRIVTMSGKLDGARWSPSGSKLCFTRAEPSGDSLWEVDRDGKGLRCMYPGLLSGLEGSYGLWTPNGEYLIAQSLCAGHSMPSAVRLSSGPFHRHSEQPACLGSAPLDLFVSAISPDSARLFGFGYAAKHPQMEEYDTHAREFKPFLPNVSAGYADFSRDGQRIAYVTLEKEITGGENLWISQIDGSHKVQITKPPLLVQLPRWSPDGRWIAFMGKDQGQAWRVRVVSVDGGSYAPVTPVNDEEGAPTWSPDSGQVAFGGMTQPPERTTGRLVIHILNLKTHQLSEVPGSEGLWTARWSPDGRYIAALTEDSRNLMLFDFRNTKWVRLATMLQIPDLVWSRHEEAIYFNAGTTGGDPAIFRMKVPSGRLERLASLKGRTERDWLGLTPDDLPLITHYTSAHEIYALTVNWP
ncbi:MAG: winged helix-turn-helix domain-containing protein [Terriglobia bacterium]|jgi:Tol biopolymer transport system component/DNA-binding winged helix-turn-helix (wHTH) protein